MLTVLQIAEFELIDLLKNSPWLAPPVAIAWVMSRFQNQRDKDRSETEAVMHSEYRKQIRTQNDAHAEQIRHAYAVQQETNQVIRELTAEIARINYGNDGRNRHASK